MTPFEQHRNLILHDTSCMASSLRRLVLALHDQQQFHWAPGDISGYDDQHLRIALSLIESYHQLGADHPDIVSLVQDILVQDRLEREHAIKECKARITSHELELAQLEKNSHTPHSADRITQLLKAMHDDQDLLARLEEGTETIPGIYPTH